MISSTPLHTHAFTLYEIKTADRKYMRGHFEYLLLIPKASIYLAFRRSAWGCNKHLLGHPTPPIAGKFLGERNFSWYPGLIKKFYQWIFTVFYKSIKKNSESIEVCKYRICHPYSLYIWVFRAFPNSVDQYLGDVCICFPFLKPPDQNRIVSPVWWCHKSYPFNTPRLLLCWHIFLHKTLS